MTASVVLNCEAGDPDHPEGIPCVGMVNVRAVDAAQARAAAALHGWTHDGGQDRCPDCSTGPAAARPALALLAPRNTRPGLS